jgi:hypothetical protein
MPGPGGVLRACQRWPEMLPGQTVIDWQPSAPDQRRGYATCCPSPAWMARSPPGLVARHLFRFDWAPPNSKPSRPLGAGAGSHSLVLPPLLCKNCQLNRPTLRLSAGFAARGKPRPHRRRWLWWAAESAGRLIRWPDGRQSGADTPRQCSLTPPPAFRPATTFPTR